MTYAVADALQVAVYERLSGNAALGALVGDAIFDSDLPFIEGVAPETHVVIGEERVRDNGSVTHQGAQHDFTVSVHSTAEGFRPAKQAAAAIGAALTETPLSLSEGAVACLRFLFAKAERGAPPDRRRVTLRFRALVEAG